VKIVSLDSMTYLNFGLYKTSIVTTYSTQSLYVHPLTILHVSC